MEKRNLRKKEKDEKPRWTAGLKKVPKKDFYVRARFLSLWGDLLREPFLDFFRHIGSDIPKLPFAHMVVHYPQDSPNNFSRIYILIEPKLCVHPSCKFLFFEFLRLIPESPAVIIYPFNYKGQLCCEIDRFLWWEPIPECVKRAPECLVSTFLALPPQLAQNAPYPYIGQINTFIKITYSCF